MLRKDLILVLIKLSSSNLLLLLLLLAKKIFLQIEANNLKGLNVRLMAVGIGSNVNTNRLDDAATSPTNQNR